jgi:hypothetical protein
MAKEWRLASCTGQENVQRAIQEKTNETPPWDVHSITPAGLTTEEHPLNPGQKFTIMNFLVLFVREAFDA